MLFSNQLTAYTPRITFQDTNLVGNVYFLTYFRWQQDCRNQWLSNYHPDLWTNIRSGKQRLVVTNWSTKFEDSFGATIGDLITANLSVQKTDGETFHTTSEFLKHGNDAVTRIASGHMKFTTQWETKPPHNDYPKGLCYRFSATPDLTDSLELLAWQGKCRELFLAEHAEETLLAVVKRKLILQTTTASIDLIQLPPDKIDSVHVEMRLETVKCGQMEVRFDYFAYTLDGRATRFAKGRQVMSSKHEGSAGVVPCALPVALLKALRQFTDSDQLQFKIDEVLAFSSSRVANENHFLT